MNIIIKGMEMPKACVYRENGHLMTCPLYDIDGYCGALNTEASHKENGKLSDCPLIHVPSHGRLIDADAAYEQFLNLMDTQGAINPCQLGTILVDAPTIIPAEESE